jgi:hypothetical protein
VDKDAIQILESDVGEYLTSPGEKILFAIRKHAFIITVPIIGTIFFSLLAILLTFVLLTHYFSFPFLFLASSFLILTFVMHLISKILVEWYFHVYLVTNRKILEVCYKPFFSENVSDVLLDQVRCTEVIVHTNGIINHLINMGDITVCFDMPTHQDQFYFSDIASPHKAGMMLSDILNSTRTTNYSRQKPTPVWYRRNTNLNPHRIIEKIIPKTSFGGVG